MSCCCTADNRIIIIKKNDTDFNNGNLVEFNITSDIYNITDFTAELILGDIKREFNDLSYGIINFNLSKEETGTLPYGNIDGVMNFIDSQGRVATISSIIPFRVIGIVENDAIKTSDVDYTINVEQGGKNIFNIDVKTNVSVRVGTVETLPSGSSAYVENVGTPTGVVLNFGIPQGIQGEQGIRGEQGIQGEKGDTGATGEAATIQVGTVNTLNPSQPAYVQNVGTEQNAIFNFGIPKGDAGSGANADFSDITGSPYDCDALAAALNEKQNVIEDLSNIRIGAGLGATAVQPSSLARVATSGSYNDLSNKPTIPTKTSDLSNDSGFITGITSTDVTTALGYTPYNSSNPNNYQENVIETIKVNGSLLNPINKAVDITIPSAPVQDVQVNGASVLEGGVANIPFASANTVGVVRTSTNFGLDMENSGGYIIISAPTTDEIASKSNQYKAVTLNRIDFAVKVGVTTNTNTLTDDEKATACSWLGAGQQRTTVVDSTTPTITIDNALANTDYQYGTITSLTITAVENSYLETNIFFTAGSEITVDLPDTLKIIGSPSFEANKQYAMSICNNTLIVGVVS